MCLLVCVYTFLRNWASQKKQQQFERKLRLNTLFSLKGLFKIQANILQIASYIFLLMGNWSHYSLATTSVSQYYYSNWRNKCSICMEHLRQSREAEVDDAGPPQPGPSSAVTSASVQGKGNEEISKCTNTQCQRVFHTNCLMDWFER